MDRAHDMARGTLRFSIHQLFMITHSHYENIDPAMMSQGFAPIYTDVELDVIEEEVAP